MAILVTDKSSRTELVIASPYSIGIDVAAIRVIAAGSESDRSFVLSMRGLPHLIDETAYNMRSEEDTRRPLDYFEPLEYEGGLYGRMRVVPP